MPRIRDIPPPSDGVPPTPVSAADVPQQPSWAEHPDLPDVMATLCAERPLVTPEELNALRVELAGATDGRRQVLQLGDCAETIGDCRNARTRAKLAVLDDLAGALRRAEGRDVVSIGRLGGQFAKPRSQPFEACGDEELPVFRGEMVNSPEATLEARAHDPHRMRRAYEASSTVIGEVGRRRAETRQGHGPWSSHEALVLDYEHALLRTDEGRPYLASTHLPWIGERTRSATGAHVNLLADVANPVACKVGPNADPDDVVELCRRLNPDRIAGRLALIVRMGRTRTESVLPGIVHAVARAGHAVVWMCDPLHGNTVTRGGRKTRVVDDVVVEVEAFRAVLRSASQPAGGLHLEVADTSVTECLGVGVMENDLAHWYTSQCDPRLNPRQARRVIDAWAV